MLKNQSHSGESEVPAIYFTKRERTDVFYSGLYLSIAGVALLALIFSGVATVSSLRGKLVPLTAWLIAPALILVVGGIGSLFLDVSADTQQLRLIARLLTLEAMTWISATFCFQVGAMAIAVVSLVGARKSRGNRTSTPRPAMLSFTLGVLTMFILFRYAGSPMLVMVCGWAVVSSVAVNLMRENDEPVHAQRRIHVATLNTLSLICYAGVWKSLIMLESFEALDDVAPADRLAELAHSWELATANWQIGIAAAAGVLPLGFVPAIPFFKDLGGKRELLDLGLAALIIALVALVSIVSISPGFGH